MLCYSASRYEVLVHFTLDALVLWKNVAGSMSVWEFGVGVSQFDVQNDRPDAHEVHRTEIFGTGAPAKNGICRSTVQRRWPA